MMTSCNTSAAGTAFRRAARCAAAFMFAAAIAGPAIAGDGRGGVPYAIGLWGGLPYNDVQAQTGVPNLIADMNAQRLKFTVNDRDLKGGNGIAGSNTPTTCSAP